MTHIHRQSHKAASLKQGPLLPLYSPYFVREGGVRNREGWVGVKVSIPARPEWSRGRTGREYGWRCGCCGGGSAGA